MTTKDIDIFEKELEDRTKLCCALADKDVEIESLRSQLDELREAAGKVQCENCHGSGFKAVRDEGALTFTFPPCPDCSDLRRLLENQP